MPRAIATRLRDHFDWPLFACVATIAVIGVVNLYSATSLSHSGLYITQIYWLMVGAACAAAIAAIDYRHFERQGYVLYGVGVGLLALVLVIGRAVRGSSRWLSLGSLTLQPSELMKLLLVIALAKYLHSDPKAEGRGLRELVVPGVLMFLPTALILKQPDLGTALILFLVFMTIMLLTRIRLRSFLMLVAIGAVSAPLAWHYLLKGYQKTRFLSFLNPTHDVLGSNWHAHQSIVAIGSGMLTGKGFLGGTQNSHGFMPDQHTDFPFPVWAEEHGFIGALLLLALYFFFVVWAVRIASVAKDRFGAIVAVGVASIVFWHVIINLGMVTGLLPVVGVTLPLFSYGGSSTLTIMLGIGLLMNISMRRYHFGP